MWNQSKRILILLMFCIARDFSWGTEQKEFAPVSTSQYKEPPKYNLSICAIFKDEDLYLKEWIEYHRLLGVDHFYLYNNESTDFSIRVLTPYIEEEVVTLIDWPNRLKFSIFDDEMKKENLLALSTDLFAYENAIKIVAAEETKWLVILSIDEFLVPPIGNKLTTLLTNFEDYPGVTLCSDCFDAYRTEDVIQSKLVIESLDLTKPPEIFSIKQVEKTIIQPKYCAYVSWPPYEFHFKEDLSAIRLNRYILRINKYLNRHKHFLESFKKAKKRHFHIDNRLLSEEIKTELFELGYVIEDQDRSIYRFLPELRKKIGCDKGWDY